MEKTIKFNGTDLRLKASLFTIIDYRNVFGTELFNDIKKLDNIKDENQSLLIDILFRIIYILNRPFSNKSYEDFLKEIDFNFLTNTDELINLSNAITELLGGSNDNPK
ncbi:MAG: hypothetical protein GX363_10210 [Clostridiales bacterium]|nr:hypothetical protein [Clostridiales bacterium]